MHPLLASSAYTEASIDERRLIHRRLAEHIDDPQERALHLALATELPNADVALALDAGAEVARRRGAPQSAAELSELARKLTPENDGEALRRRTVRAAEHHYEAGDEARARALFDEAIRNERPGWARADLLYRIAAISWMDIRRVQQLCEQALKEAGRDPQLLALLHDYLAWVAIYRGDMVGASEHAAASMEWAQQVGDPAIRADVTSTSGMMKFLMGRPSEAFMLEAETLQDRAALEGLQGTVYTTARTTHGLKQLWAGDLAGARETLHKELSLYEQRGRYLIRDELLCYLAELECRAGKLDLAGRQAQEAYEIVVESGRVSGRGHVLFPKALVAAHRGNVDQARSDAQEGLRLCLLNEDLLDSNCIRAVLGFLELSLSNHPAAIEHLKPAVSFLQAFDAAEPGIIPCIPDTIEALVTLGESGEAEALLADHEAKARRLDRPWALATAARCRGLLAAARGDLPQALGALDESLGQHERVPQPFELGRTLLVAGEVHRRAKQKRVARGRFEDALKVFDEVGASLWAEKAKAGLRRTGVRAQSPAGLTPTERRVAELVAEGRTNKEVADALFVSLRTVEANLSRVYHKLGIRSRTELTRRIVASEVPSDKGR
jgi:DNA-binding CsgD family transcriptional regulator